MARGNSFFIVHLRYFCLVLIIATLIPGLVPLSGREYVAQDAAYLALVTSGWWALSLFWNAFVIIWESCRGKLIYPGAVIGLDLLISLYGLVVITWGIWQIVDVNFQYGWAKQWPWILQVDLKDRNMSTACFAVFAALVTVATLLHLALLVVGCKNEHERRKCSESNRMAWAKNDSNNGTDGPELIETCIEPTCESSNFTSASPPRYSTSTYSGVATTQVPNNEGNEIWKDGLSAEKIRST